MKIPNKDEDFTLEFFQEKLAKFPKIKSYEIKKPATHGMMSNTRKIMLEYAEENKENFPASVIVKFAGKEMVEKMPNLLLGGVIYGSEYRLYDYFETHSELKEKFCRLPEIYFNYFDEEKGEFIILMEDLASTAQEKGENELLKKCSLLGVRKIISQIAKVHRLFWHKNVGDKRKFLPFIGGNDDEFLKGQGLSWLMEDFQFVYHTQMFRANLSKLGEEEKKNSWGVFNEENLSSLTENLLDKFETSKKILEEKCLCDCHEGMEERYKKVVVDMDWRKIYPETYRKMTLQDDLTMRHGDFRVDNIAVVDSEDAEVLGIFDWQCVSSGNGLLDVSSIMVCGLSWEEMRDHEEELLRLYHKELDLKEVSYEQVKELFKHALVYEMIKAVHWTADCSKYKDHPQFGSAYLGLLRQFQNCLVSVLKNY